MTTLTRLAIQRPRWTLALVAALTVWFALGVARLTTDAGFRSYLGSEHPAVRRLDAFIARFGGGLPAAIVWSCDQTPRCTSVFDPASLRMAKAIAQRLARTAGVQRVESPATSALLVPSGEGLAVRHFLEGDELASDHGQLVRWALQDPSWRRRLVSEYGTVGAILLQLASSDSETNARVVEIMLEEVARYETQGFRFHLVGDPVGFVIAAQDLEADARRLVPVILGLIFIVIVILFRSWRHGLLCLGTVTLALVWTLGTAGWLGWPQTAVSQALAPFVLVIGVCDAIHFLSRLSAQRNRCHGLQSAVIATTQEVSRACLFTTLTTAGGFLSFAGAGIESFAHFGSLAAIGVLFALILTFSFLPAALLFVSESHQPGSPDPISSILIALTGAVRLRPRLTAGVAIGVTVLAGIGLNRLTFDVDLSEVFGENSRIVRWRRFADSHVASAGALEIEIRARAESLLDSARMEEAVRDLQDFLPTISGIDSARSALDLTGHVRAMLPGEAELDSNRPQSPVSTSEAIFLLSLARPSLLDPWISLDGRRTRISAEAHQRSATESGRMLSEVKRYLQTDLPPDYSYSVTGSFSIQYDLFSEVQRLQVRSFAVAWGVVGALLAVFLGSVRLALLGMVPTTAPVVVTLGMMGFWGINLDIGTAMVGAVVLGIAVDDTIHLLSVYQEQRRRGRGAGEAIRDAVLRVGHAVVTTSLALVLGFFTMTVSSWQSVASFGLLAGLAILIALAADLVLLPALIMGWGGRRGGAAREGSGSA